VLAPYPRAVACVPILFTMDRLRERSESPMSVRSSVDEDEHDMGSEAPLDLSVKWRERVYESYTDSDGDSDGGKQQGKAYKKNLMKRYCKFLLISTPLRLPTLFSALDIGSRYR